MPWKIKKKGDKYEVINKATGESKGISDSLHKAIGHLRALHRIKSGKSMIGKKGKPFEVRKLFKGKKSTKQTRKLFK